MRFHWGKSISAIIPAFMLPKQMRYQLRYTRTSGLTYASPRLNASEICSIGTQTHRIAPICTISGREKQGKNFDGNAVAFQPVSHRAIAQLQSILTNKSEIQKAARLWSGVIHG